MKKFNEWRHEATINENPEVLIDKIANLANEMERELTNFGGERFEGFLDIIGNIKNLKRTIAEVDTGSYGDVPRFMTAEDCGEPHKPRKMKKLDQKEVVSKGTRKGSGDLSSDYKGHIKMNGDVEPFRVMSKK